jgi:hypothetical protein
VIGVLVLTGLLAQPGSASAANFTWSGAAARGEPKWSNGTNWEGSAPSGSVEKLTFPALTSVACTAKSPTATCYQSNNDLSGLSASTISIDDGGKYHLGGNAITLGAGGLSASTSSTSSGGVASLGLPITLGASQTWSIDGNGHDEVLQIGFPSEPSTVAGTSALTFSLSHRSDLEIRAPGDVEVGEVKITGTEASHTGFESRENGYLVLAGGLLNATSGRPVSLTHAEIFASEGTVGALTSIGGALRLGQAAVPAGGLAVAGGVTLDSGNYTTMFISHAGTAARTDYSQLSATGNVNLGGRLALEGHNPEGLCPTLTLGDVDTLITTKGLLTGTFASLPEGATISLECSGTRPTVKINYSEHAVTATVVGGAEPPSNTSPPTVSGTAQQGQTLTEVQGSWAYEPTSYSYQWQRCDGTGNNCTAISGATSQTYTLTASDVGHTIRVQETASNAAGPGKPATSAPTAPVASPPSGGGGSGGATGEGAGGSVLAFQSASVPAPVVGQRQTVTVLAGTVTIRRKGRTTFEPLSESASIPDGSEIDATNGRIVIKAIGPKGETVTAEVYGGRFRVHQDSSGETHFILTLHLAGCPPVALPRGSASTYTAKRHGPRSRHLWVTETGGKWGTNGRFVSSSVEGTTWLTLDECTRSEVKVTAGNVKVHDLVRKKVKTVSAGKRYVANSSGRRRP